MQREPWVCPVCGRTLMVRNQEHVCGLFELEPHFDGKDPVARVAFDWICSELDGLGAYDVLPMKTMIAFANRVNVAFIRTKRRGVEVSLVLAQAPASPRFFQTVAYSRSKSIHRVLVLQESELDVELRTWLRAAYLESQPC
jgi:hypothetical protein